MTVRTDWFLGTICAGCILASPIVGSEARERVFQQLLDDPANTQLMLRYARLSVEEQDYEAAIGTLERLVRENPTSQEARLELAIAYFALGQDDVARYHLGIYRERADLTPDEQALVDRYIENLEARNRPLTFGGFAEAGLFHQSDLGESGLTFDLALNASYDLGRQNLALWDTLFRVRGVRYPDLSVENETVFQIRTGPVISLDGTTFGPRLQPYLEVAKVNEEDDASAALATSLGLGYTTILSSGGSFDADLQVGEIDRDGFGVDSRFHTLSLGRTVEITDAFSVGVSARYLSETFDEGDSDRDRLGFRVGIRRDIESPLFGLRDMTLGAFVRAELESLSTGRDDDILGAGVSVRAYFRPGSYVNASISKFNRSSSDPLFDSQDTLLSVVAGMEF